MTKKDNCFDYSTVQITDKAFLDFYIQNKDSITQQKIKLPQYTETKNDVTQIHSSSIDHSNHGVIEIITGRDTALNEDLDDYYFDEDVGFDHQKNINYAYNIHSFIKRLQVLIAQAIQNAAKQQKLTKLRR